MVGMKRGDQSFSCSKKVVISYMGTAGRHGGDPWVSFLHVTGKHLHLQVPTACSNKRIGSSRRSLPTVTTVCLSFPPLRWNPVTLQVALCTVLSR